MNLIYWNDVALETPSQTLKELILECLEKELHSSCILVKNGKVVPTQDWDFEPIFNFDCFEVFEIVPGG